MGINMGPHAPDPINDTVIWSAAAALEQFLPTRHGDLPIVRGRWLPSSLSYTIDRWDSGASRWPDCCAGRTPHICGYL